MAGRGGFRGGRGGGRGGFGRGTGLEVDGLAISFHDVPLFPEMKLPPIFKKLIEDETDLLSLDKKWVADFKDSPFHIEAPPVRDAAVKMAKGGMDLKRLKDLEKEEQTQGKRQKIGGIEDDDEPAEDNGYDEEDQEEEDDYVNDFYDDDHDGVGGDESDHGGGDY
ncbi:UNVERIFIED_CONTAM: hypothetical protein HDU68_009154 [Siphonaria sp. JEL0065]|nr:hypothetical protein HDU68_009154 [Siphonaria sp. JEL0065]